jgi:hypothetical protein
VDKKSVEGEKKKQNGTELTKDTKCRKIKKNKGMEMSCLLLKWID